MLTIGIIFIARHWNCSDPSKKPVLCIHGWKDNAATFDRLFPILIPELSDYQFLAIDLPGHGKSSHFPPGMIYSVQDIWVLIKRIKNFFDWEKISLIGHSMGAQLSFSYCGTHPKFVEKMVLVSNWRLRRFNLSGNFNAGVQLFFRWLLMRCPLLL